MSGVLSEERGLFVVFLLRIAEVVFQSSDNNKKTTVCFHSNNITVSLSLSVFPSGEDISLSVSQVLSCRHFCNKMWQTVRFTLGVLEDRGAELGTVEQVMD
jgi:hypothetical protein